MDIATFRTDFPEFADATLYPDAQVTYWLGIAPLLMNADRYGNLMDHGTELFIAHNLVLSKLARDTSAVGGYAGLNKGTPSSEGAGATISYSNSATVELDAGHWNLTDYGTRFVRLVKLVGAGPLQFTGGFDGTGIIVGSGPGSGNNWGGW